MGDPGELPEVFLSLKTVPAKVEEQNGELYGWLTYSLITATLPIPRLLGNVRRRPPYLSCMAILLCIILQVHLETPVGPKWVTLFPYTFLAMHESGQCPLLR